MRKEIEKGFLLDIYYFRERVPINKLSAYGYVHLMAALIDMILVQVCFNCLIFVIVFKLLACLRSRR